MSETASHPLTINDPVDEETLKTFQDLLNAQGIIAERLLEIEKNKVRLLRAAMDNDAQRQQTFNRVLEERGLPPGSPVEIDAKTGAITIPSIDLPATPPTES